MAACYLISCVSQKASAPAPAEMLYISDWFKKARAYVVGRMRSGDQWFVLSAKHHLLDPREEVAPYGTALNRMSQSQRYEWGRHVIKQLLPKLSPGDVVIILAGSRYRASIAPALCAAGYSVSVPMEGLGIGKQKAWLRRRILECDGEPS